MKREKRNKNNARFNKIAGFLLDLAVCVFAFIVTVLFSNKFLSEIFSWESAVSLLFAAGFVLLSMFALDCYSGLRKYAGRVDIVRVIVAHFISAALLGLLDVIPFIRDYSFFGDLNFIGFFTLTSIFFAFTARFLPWFVNYLRHINARIQPDSALQKTLIIGAGYTGAYAINRFINNTDLGILPVAVIDDDADKHAMTLSGVRVVGGRDALAETVRKFGVEMIVIAIHHIKRSELKSLYESCRALGVPVKLMPPISDDVAGKEIKLADIQIEELLGRDEFKIKQELVDSCVKGKTVLVTGGAGSIGGELCRQALKFDCRRLIVLDAWENGLFELDNELAKKYKGRYTVVVGNIRDENKLKSVFEAYKPQTVFHAAAYKHVPMMEHSPVEAIKTNVFGTLNVVKSCIAGGAEKLISISTDKAVNPANIMGATKRIAEMVIQAYGKESGVKMAAVRFGNVVGSSGSAIPIFLKQISEGGPVTVTHRDIKRYFMTIPEAVSLVLQAGAFAEMGEVFVLDMGEPVEIYTLAEDLIRLSGYKPHEDIEIEITGLRPGEKLFEELRFDDETHEPTRHEGIFVNKLQGIGGAWLAGRLRALRERVDAEDAEGTERAIFETVPSAYRVKAE
ncbi:MAG: polysaccharide biosynthesis protein [Clostridiales bacterium]|jgi:FlaA1/EpsC-like NDP-sugar epimerase|nr:polysaccharide biosynthesis protein [Clostridiales bacterium]